jgi:hypothetical protein
MRFAQWLSQQEELVPRQLPEGSDFQGIPLNTGEQNYALMSISGFQTGAATVTGFLGPITRQQLEGLRDHLMALFPPPGKVTAGA